ncbi:MAG: hypothetical protein IKH12_07215, partial [Clostridia bacterium]|nr:hypothetical protein [Clostridia bacterium]
SPGLSFSFLRTFSFFRPKERETAVLVESGVSGAGSSQPQLPRQSGRRIPSRASVLRGAPRSACPAAVPIAASRLLKTPHAARVPPQMKNLSRLPPFDFYKNIFH